MLRDGKSTPDFVASMLKSFGTNPHGEPNYRLIWSERKMIHFLGEMIPEYRGFDVPGWVLETWLSPEKDGGTPEQWDRTTHGMLGPYPTQGTYNFVKQYPTDWYPTEQSVRAICFWLEKSRDVSMKDRVKAIRANKEAEAAAARRKVAEEIVEMQDSGSRGLIVQPASGKKNNFRTTDDFERDAGRGTPANLPLHGGKIY